MYAYATGQEHDELQDALHEKMYGRPQPDPKTLEKTFNRPIVGYGGHTHRRDYDYRERDEGKAPASPRRRVTINPVPSPDHKLEQASSVGPESPTMHEELRHLPPNWSYLHSDPSAHGHHKPMPGLSTHYRGRMAREYLPKRRKPDEELDSLLKSIGGLVGGATSGFASGDAKLARATAPLSTSQHAMADAHDPTRSTRLLNASTTATRAVVEKSDDGQYHLDTVKIPLGFVRKGGEIEKVGARFVPHCSGALPVSWRPPPPPLPPPPPIPPPPPPPSPRTHR